MIPFKDMTDNQLIMYALFLLRPAAKAVDSGVWKELEKRAAELRTNPSRAEWDERVGKPFVRTCSEAGISFNKTDELGADNEQG